MESKAALKRELLVLLRRDLALAEKAHKATLAGVTHEEAKPENDTDTRALEQSYLARGQAVRVEELREGVVLVDAMSLREGAGEARAALGSLVRVLEADRETTYWIAAYGGGGELSNKEVHVVTPKSPMGRALIGKSEGDEVEVSIAGKLRTLEVVSVG